MAYGLLFVALRQEGAIARYYYRYGTKGIGYIICSGGLYSTIISIIFIFIALFFSSEILLYLVLNMLVTSMLNAQLVLRQCQKSPSLYLRIQITHALSSILITVAFFELLSANIEARFIAMLFAGIIAITFAIYDGAFLLKRSYFSRKKILLGVKFLFFFGAPLFIHQLSFLVKSQFDKIYIYNMFDSLALGRYTAAYQIAGVLVVLILAANKAFIPFIFEKIKGGDINCAKLRRFSLLSILIVPIFPLIFLIFPEYFITYLLGEEFTGISGMLAAFLSAFGFMIPYLILSSFMFYHGKTKLIATCTVVSVILYAGFAYIASLQSLELIPWALVVSNVVLYFMMYFYSLKYE
jgi:O-antigen/teichoic acid export membrane protein